MQRLQAPKVREEQAIESHLDLGGLEYLQAISKIHPSGSIEMIERLLPLAQHIKDGATVLSVGTGGGDELCALYDIFENRVELLGVDISRDALSVTSERIQRNSFHVKLIQADAVSLPFEDGSVDAVVLSSTLHEVYSYHEKGLDAAELVLQEVGRVLKPGGIFFLRDFMPAQEEAIVKLRIQTPLAMSFYNTFQDRFRQFPHWKGSRAMRREKNFLPAIGNGTIFLPITKASEVLNHFCAYWSDYQQGNRHVQTDSWKEFDESYFLWDGDEPLSAGNYFALIEASLGPGFSEVYKKVRERYSVNSFLERHFSMLTSNNVNAIPLSTKKLECMYQKTNDPVKQYSAAVIFDENNNVLLCRRSMDKKVAPGMWHLPGGTVELHESAKETIVRELKEELDITAEAVRSVEATITPDSKSEYQYETHIFFVTTSNKPVIMNEENDAFEFVSLDRLGEYIEEDLLPANLEVIQKAQVL